VGFSITYKPCELEYIINIQSYQNTNKITFIAYCLRAFPLLWNVASAREWDFTACALRENIADDAMQMDVRKTLYPFCTTKEMPRGMVAITEKRFVDNNSQVLVLRQSTQ